MPAFAEHGSLRRKREGLQTEKIVTPETDGHARFRRQSQASSFDGSWAKDENSRQRGN